MFDFFKRKELDQPKGKVERINGVHILTRQELEARAIEGTRKAVREYRRVFERLEEYDRV